MKADHFGQRGHCYAALDHADQHTGLAACQGRNGTSAQASGQQPVESRRRAAALYMSQRGRAQVEANARLVFAKVGGQRLGIVARPLGHDGQGMGLAAFVSGA